MLKLLDCDDPEKQAFAKQVLTRIVHTIPASHFEQCVRQHNSRITNNENTNVKVEPIEPVDSNVVQLQVIEDNNGKDVIVLSDNSSTFSSSDDELNYIVNANTREQSQEQQDGQCES